MIRLADLKKQYNTRKPEIYNTNRDIIENTSFIGEHLLKEFENNFKNYVGVNYCMSSANNNSIGQSEIETKNIKTNYDCYGILLEQIKSL